MKSYNIKYYLLCVIILGIYSCNNQWDDHIKIKDQYLENNLYEVISKDKNLSVFNEFLINTGYSAILSQSNNYTVFAPDNDALSDLTDAPIEIQKSIVSNHIALLTNKKEDLQNFVKMINGKNLNINDIRLKSDETLCNNGILRVASNIVMPKNNIYEYIISCADENDMAAFIVSKGDSVMDSEKSIQKGIDKLSGLPFYDTIWTYMNPFIDSISINNEDSTYLMILLDNNNFKSLKSKYARYMIQYDDTDSIKTYDYASEALIYDLICHNPYSEFISVNGINIDMDLNSIKKDIDLSNGKIIIADNVNIRMKNNKIKDIIIEAENFVDCLEPTWVYTRLRDEAQGGRDVMLSGYWSPSKTVSTTTSEGLDTTYTISYKFYYEGSSGKNYSQKINSYIKYRPEFFSTDYNVFWVSNNDIKSHYVGDVNDPDYDPLIPNQACTSVHRSIMKLYVAEEGKNLNWASGIIENKKFSGKARMMVGIDPEMVNERKPELGVNAGVLKVEQPLRWHQATGDYDAVGVALTSSSTRDILSIKCAGKTDIMVTNSYSTTESSSTINGFIFLDYIRFSPVLNENE